MNLIPFIHLHVALCGMLPCGELTLCSDGHVLSTDGAGRAGLRIDSKGGLCRMEAGRWRRIASLPPRLHTLRRDYCALNRTELFCWRQAGCLSGLYYAETLNSHLRRLHAVPDRYFAPSRSSSFYVTWLVMLADHLTGRPGALRGVSLNVRGETRLTMGHDTLMQLHLDADGRLLPAEEMLLSPDEKALRYLRLYALESRLWRMAFAHFGRLQAVGKEGVPCLC